jgi:uncharacterized protein
MKERVPDPRRLDLGALCRNADSLQGQCQQSALPRLAEGLFAAADEPPPPPVDWQAAGELRPVRGGEAEMWLTLHARTTVRLQCQRCLQPMPQLLDTQRRLRFVADEDEAARLDELSEDDVLALHNGRVDLLELVEDELILALPLVPRHEDCPQPLPLSAGLVDAGDAGDAAATEVAPHPFAALAAWRVGTAAAPADGGTDTDGDTAQTPDPAPARRKPPPH